MNAPPANFEEMRRILRQLPGPDQTAQTAVVKRQTELTKPPGSLGRLEAIADDGQADDIGGEIGEDFAHYLVTSEQVPSVVALGVLITPDQRVAAAGGFVVQVLPGAAPEVPRYLEERVAELAASGLTNREVGRAAFLAPKSVEGVLARVYAKLGIRSRAELGRAVR